MMDDKEKIHNLIKSDRPINWLFTGDSITHGAFHTFGRRCFAEHFSERIRSELGRGLDYVINSGISGDRINKILEQFERRISYFKPDVVFLMIGMNDAANGQESLKFYEADLVKIIDLIRRGNGIPVINTPNPIITQIGSGALRRCLPEYVDIMWKIAQHKNVMLIDHWNHWKTVKSDENQMMAWLADSIHPNFYGHIEIAKEIFRYLNIYDDNSKVCQLFVP